MDSLVGALLRPSERLGYALKRRVNPDSALARGLVDALLLPSDIWKILHHHRVGHGAYPNLFRPVTFSAYQQRTKLTLRDPLRSRLADKIAVRDYVAERVGTNYLSRHYWTGTDLGEVDRAQLPDAFVIKANNGSGTNIVVFDKADLDWDAATRTARDWLKHDQSRHYGEWYYRWIRPRLLIEEFIGTDGVASEDLKFYCFHGQPLICKVIGGRFGRKTRTFLDIDFRPLDLRRDDDIGPTEVARPGNFDELLDVARRLSAGHDFVRVDLYASPRILFGEMTFHPEAGNTHYTPRDWDRRLYADYLLKAASRPAPTPASATGPARRREAHSRSGVSARHE